MCPQREVGPCLFWGSWAATRVGKALKVHSARHRLWPCPDTPLLGKKLKAEEKGHFPPHKRNLVAPWQESLGGASRKPRQLLYGGKPQPGGRWSPMDRPGPAHASLSTHLLFASLHAAPLPGCPPFPPAAPNQDHPVSGSRALLSPPPTTHHGLPPSGRRCPSSRPAGAPGGTGSHAWNRLHPWSISASLVG